MIRFFSVYFVLLFFLVKISGLCLDLSILLMLTVLILLLIVWACLTLLTFLFQCFSAKSLVRTEQVLNNQSNGVFLLEYDYLRFLVDSFDAKMPLYRFVTWQKKSYPSVKLLTMSFLQWPAKKFYQNKEVKIHKNRRLFHTLLA